MRKKDSWTIATKWKDSWAIAMKWKDSWTIPTKWKDSWTLGVLVVFVGILVVYAILGQKVPVTDVTVEDIAAHVDGEKTVQLIPAEAPYKFAGLKAFDAHSWKVLDKESKEVGEFLIFRSHRAARSHDVIFELFSEVRVLEISEVDFNDVTVHKLHNVKHTVYVYTLGDIVFMSVTPLGRERESLNIANAITEKYE